jgi:hypothetical protein
MTVEGGCYCGAVRYEAEGDPVLRLQCHCRECQYISGGSPNVSMVMPEAGFRYTKGTPQTFTRSDLDKPVTRAFCATCGTHLVSRTPNVPGAVIIKVGTMDDPALFEPDMAIFTIDMQSFHSLPEGKPAFERVPG